MIVCDVCGHVNPDGLQYCENCGVELKVAAKTEAPPVTPVAPHETPQSTASQGGQAPSSASVVEEALTDAPAAVGGAVAQMVEQPILDAVPAPTEGTIINNPETTPAEPQPGGVNIGKGSPADSSMSSPLPEVSVPASVEQAIQDAAASGTVSSEPVSSVPVPQAQVDSSAQPQSQGGEVPDRPLSSETLHDAQSAGAPGGVPVGTPVIPVPADMAAPAAPTSGQAPTPAKLGIKKFGALTGDTIPLMGTHLTVGRFDPSTGPVEIDVSSLPGAEHISRRHAEIFFDGGQWKVRDLGSTNGVFVKKAGEGSFSPRLQTPMALGNHDEIAFGNMILVFLAG